MYGLGVTLKCACQEKSAKYEFLRSTDLPYMKGLDKAMGKALKAYQAELGDSGTAILLMCDCGAWYLLNDQGDRRRIRGEGEANGLDKDHNKQIAAELAERGVARVLRPPPGAGAGTGAGQQHPTTQPLPQAQSRAGTPPSAAVR
ncbi:hypothetical protein GPECTOR_45g192 [Gonium pectorale]|uniref:Uncharacterized protein n=1 Tax=Gonium pectorale TaxID=33097 RepID=A0A150G901_GONPE|nr:hypothetical protein GPECTOR_45g192 [Gonium pectorale]|eukprot:KXZ46322.1 hypothetical protein GPECTOR_45g192 [Gonium pectorale]